MHSSGTLSCATSEEHGFGKEHWVYSIMIVVDDYQELLTIEC